MRALASLALLLAGCHAAPAAADMSLPTDLAISEFGCPQTIADYCGSSCTSEAMIEAEAQCNSDMGGHVSVDSEDCGALKLFSLSRGADSLSISVYDATTGQLVAVLGESLTGELVCGAGPAILALGPCGKPVTVCSR